MTKKEAGHRLEELLMQLHRYREDYRERQERGDQAGVERARQNLQLQHSLIRSHCEKNGLELPKDVPEEE